MKLISKSKLMSFNKLMKGNTNFPLVSKTVHPSPPSFTVVAFALIIIHACRGRNNIEKMGRGGEEGGYPLGIKASVSTVLSVIVAHGTVVFCHKLNFIYK